MPRKSFAAQQLQLDPVLGSSDIMVDNNIQR